MITFFAVLVIASIVLLTFFLLAGWLINRPDTGTRAKPTAEDRRAARAWLAGDRWAASFWPADKRPWWRTKNVSRPGSISVPPTGEPPAGPGHHHAHGAGWVPASPASPVRCTDSLMPPEACADPLCPAHAGTEAWDELHARADAWYGAPEIDAALIARADAVLAGAAA